MARAPSSLIHFPSSNGSPLSSPILAATALASDDDRAECLARGMDGFITKPIRMEGLEALLRLHLAGGSGRKSA